MLNYIWGAMLVISFMCALCTGRMSELSQAALNGAGDAVQLLISMAGVMCLWTGLMKIADMGGLTAILSKLFAPVLSKLMPDYEKGSSAQKAVCANIAANLLGLGNAATPFGIAAMKEMEKTNKTPGVANKSMIMFVVLNTASIQLIPTTISALRSAAGSGSPMDILPCIWVVSVLSLLVGIIAAKCFEPPKRRLSPRGCEHGGV